MGTAARLFRPGIGAALTTVKAEFLPEASISPLELQPRLKRDHAWTAIGAQSDSQQARRRRGCVGKRSKAALGGRLSWNASLHYAGKAEIRMVEDIKELTLKPQLHMLGQGEPFCQVEVTPEEIGTAQGITAEVSELAILRAVTPGALSCVRINRRNEGIRIEPLNCAQWGCGKVAMTAIGIHSRHKTGELRPAALHNSFFQPGALIDS
jgi:hypothetical protein